VQGVYYRKSHRHAWHLVGPTHSAPHAERLMRRVALRSGRGMLLYVEVRRLLLTARRLRTMGKMRVLAHHPTQTYLIPKIPDSPLVKKKERVRS